MKNMFKIGICLLITLCGQGMNAGFRNFRAFSTLAKMRFQPGLRTKMLGAGLVAGAGVTAAGAQDGQKQQQNAITNVKITTGNAIVSHGFVASPFFIYAYLGGSPWSNEKQSPKGASFNERKVNTCRDMARSWGSWLFDREIEHRIENGTQKIRARSGNAELNMRPVIFASDDTVQPDSSRILLDLDSDILKIRYAMAPSGVFSGAMKEFYSATTVEIAGHEVGNKEILKVYFKETYNDETQKGFVVDVTRLTKAACEKNLAEAKRKYTRFDHSAWVYDPKLDTLKGCDDFMRQCRKHSIEHTGIAEKGNEFLIVGGEVAMGQMVNNNGY